MARKSNAQLARMAMPPEESARRLTALLNRKPRSGKTRAYLETLPKRPKLVVSPDEYAASTPKPVSFVAEPIAARIIARDKGGAEIATFARKDRLRPRAMQTVPTRWNCRAEGRFRQDWSRRAERVVRTLALTTAQRLLLYVAQDGLCGLCGEAMAGRPFEFSLDHVIPRSLDGQDGLGNLILCHGECNGRKTNDTPTGCEMVFLLAVNARLGAYPQVF